MQVEAVDNHTYSLASLPLHLLQHIAKSLDLSSQLHLSQASKRVYPFLPVQYKRGYCHADCQTVDKTLQDACVLNGIDLLPCLPCHFSQTDSNVEVMYSQVNGSNYTQVAAITHSRAQYHLCITQSLRGWIERKLEQTLSKQQLQRKLGHASAHTYHFRPHSGRGKSTAVCSNSSARLGLSSKKGVSPAEVRQCASYCFQLMLNANWVQADLYIKLADKAADKQYCLGVSRSQSERREPFSNKWIESADWRVDQKKSLITPVELDFDNFPIEATGVSAYFFSDMPYGWQKLNLVYISNIDTLFEACRPFVYTKSLGHDY